MSRKLMTNNKTSSSGLPGGCLMLFGLPFLAAGLAMAWFYFSGLAAWWNARTWIETPCRIITTELKTKSSDDGTSYEATGSYTYLWEGREYQSNRISLQGGGDSLGDYQKRVFRSMRKALLQQQGAALCYVNPRNPRESVISRELRPSQLALFSLFASLFPLLGAGVVGAGWYAGNQNRAAATLKHSHPEEPWRWKAQWNASPIPESVWGAGRVKMIVSAWWLLVSAPLLLAGLADGIHSRPEMAWLALPGVFFLAASTMAAHQIRERARIGFMAIDIDLPLRPGQEITGAWITQKPLHPRDSPVLTIICTKSTTTRSGGKSSTAIETVWKHQQPLGVIDQRREISGFHLPFRLFIPSDADETTFNESPVGFSWKIQFHIPGTPVKSSFELPLVRDPDHPAPDRADESVDTKAADAEHRLPELLEQAKIDAEFDANQNLISLACRPRRLLASIIFLLLFNIIWTGFAIFLLQSDAPLLFKIIWPATSAGIWILLFYQMTSSRELRLENGQISLTRRIFIYKSVATFPSSSVSAITHGTNSRVNNTNYYWVKISTSAGDNFTVATGIAGESAALGITRNLRHWSPSPDH